MDELFWGGEKFQWVVKIHGRELSGAISVKLVALK